LCLGKHKAEDQLRKELEDRNERKETLQRQMEAVEAKEKEFLEELRKKREKIRQQLEMEEVWERSIHSQLTTICGVDPRVSQDGVTGGGKEKETSGEVKTLHIILEKNALPFPAEESTTSSGKFFFRL
jgi:seryl-tRNA synthetase